MLALLNQWNGRVTLWLARISAVILAVLAVLTFLDVVARYFFNAPFSFTVELTELAMGLIVYLAVGLTTHKNEHISVDFVTLRLGERTRAVLEFVTGLLAIAFLVLMVWRIWLQADLLLAKGDKTPVRGWPIWPVAFIMAAGSIFFLTGMLARTGDALGRITGRQEKDAAHSEKPYMD